MINWLKTWSKGIVIAVIISTIIEMILPNSTSKKYIKIIIGIFIVYTIISPVIETVTNEDLSKYMEDENYIMASTSNIQTNEISDTADSSIKKIYIQNLQNDLKTKLKEEGYVAGSIEIDISNDDSYNIEKIDVKIDEKVTSTESNEKEVYTIVDNIKKVKVEVENNNSQSNEIIDEKDKTKIKEYINQIYEVDLNKINVS